MPDIKRPVTGPGPEKSEAETPIVEPPKKKKKGGFFKVLLTIIIIVVIILVALYLVSKYTSFNVLNISKSEITASGWHAVFLSNGQVYFGKITRQRNEVLVLADIYYLQVTRQIQPPAEGTTPQQQNVSLVKLGNELHGPMDSMNINMDHVLFTEELKKDSRVVDAIKRYLEENQ